MEGKKEEGALGVTQEVEQVTRRRETWEQIEKVSKSGCRKEVERQVQPLTS